MAAVPFVVLHARARVTELLEEGDCDAVRWVTELSL